MNSSFFPVGSAYSWNGPICSICTQGYIGNNHECQIDVLEQKIKRLQDKIEELQKSQAAEKSDFTRVSDTTGCPCRRENGGSGICGCIMGSWTIS